MASTSSRAATHTPDRPDAPAPCDALDSSETGKHVGDALVWLFYAGLTAPVSLFGQWAAAALSTETRRAALFDFIDSIAAIPWPVDATSKTGVYTWALRVLWTAVVNVIGAAFLLVAVVSIPVSYLLPLVSFAAFARPLWSTVCAVRCAPPAFRRRLYTALVRISRAGAFAACVSLGCYCAPGFLSFLLNSLYYTAISCLLVFLLLFSFQGRIERQLAETATRTTAQYSRATPSAPSAAHAATHKQGLAARSDEALLPTKGEADKRTSSEAWVGLGSDEQSGKAGR